MSQNYDGTVAANARQSLGELRSILHEARTSDDAERVHAALVEVTEGLINQAERQTRAIEDIRSDLTHKQGIVTRIGGGDFEAAQPPKPLREFAASSNGDRWLMGRDGDTGIAYVVHEANASSGGTVTRIELAAFLNRNPGSPEHSAVLRAIGRQLD